jgi:signal transduction histidine kinase
MILNLIVNAAHAIANVIREGGPEKGKITIQTRSLPEWAEIRIKDTGSGIAEEIRGRIFDPFFTTKEIGKGTGQGLAIARSVVVDKHGGTIHFETETGKGTTFIIRLPRESETLAPKAVAA